MLLTPVGNKGLALSELSVLRFTVVGIDLSYPDIEWLWYEDGGAIDEVNPNPPYGTGRNRGLRVYLSLTNPPAGYACG